MALSSSVRYFGHAFLGIGLLLPAASTTAATPPATVHDFFAGQGCAIGPSTRSAALDAGFQESAIDALVEAAKLDDQAIVTGEWIVLAPDKCTIRLPKPASALALSDPEVMKATSSLETYYNELDWEDYSDKEDWGCFLSTPDLHKNLRQSRLWDDDTINLEYMRLLGGAIAKGHASFYSSSPLRTPPGFQILTGECANVPAMPDIRAGHEFLSDNFDPLIRTIAASLPCDPDANLVTVFMEDVADTFEEELPPNAWLGLDIMTIAMGAGWYEDMKMTTLGPPRPPLCHYP